MPNAERRDSRPGGVKKKLISLISYRSPLERLHDHAAHSLSFIYPLECVEHPVKMSTAFSTSVNTDKADFAVDSRPITAPATETATGGPTSAESSDGPATKCDAEDEKDGEKNSSVQDEAPDTPPEYLAGLKLFTVMSGITVVMMLAMLDITIISTAIPQITSDFNRLEDIGWYVGAYQLASATVQPLTGKMYTYFSTKVRLDC